MIYGVINCYNDFPLIQNCVESMAPLVDLIVAVDGRYEDFEQMNGSDISTDGTLEYLERRNDTKVIIWPNVSEVHKRNCYLVGQYPADWYLHLDADEVWHGPLEIPDADMGIVRLKWRKTGNWMDRVRLFRHVPGISYQGKHYWLHDEEGRTFALLEKPGKAYTAQRLDNWIEHFDEDRPPQRQTLKKTYYRTLVKRENQITEVS